MHLEHPGVARLVGTIALLGFAAVPVRASAQQTTAQPPSPRHQELQRELDSTQRALTDYRANRLQLAARYDKVMSELADERAQTLSLSTEQGSLRQLDSILVTAQNKLALQRERLKALRKAVGSRDQSMLVVLFRTDPGQRPSSIALDLDGASTASKSYSDTTAAALRAGGADELFRGSVLPVEHTVSISTTVNGQPVSQTATVTPASHDITYLEFDLRGGRLVQNAWRSPAPAVGASSGSSSF